ncbi:MAG TPA: sensor histidine kinase [Candidatus Anoxymicrobiaceae bacterium]|jgi:signal transduction histidine kinase
MRIRTKLTIVLLLVALVPLAGVSITGYVIGRRTVTRQILNQLESVASIQKSRVESMLRQNDERLALLESRTALKSALETYASQPGTDVQTLLYPNLIDARSAVQSFQNIFILNPGGTVIASTDPLILGTSKAEEAYFKDGKGSNISEIFFTDSHGKLMRYLAGPITYNGRLLGVIVVVGDADNMLALTRDYSGLGETGETVIAQKTPGGDIQYITPNRFGKSIPLGTVLPGNTGNLPMEEALAGREILIQNETDYRGVPVLAATKYIAGPGWGLVTKMDKSEALALVNNLGVALIVVTLGVALIAVAFALLMARSVTQPVTELTDAALEISKGNLNRRARVSAHDEVGQLGLAFNLMTDELLEARAGLEKQVEERTAKLAATNRELEGYAHTVSHDLKGPLAAAVVVTSLVTEYADQPGFSGEIKRLMVELQANIGKCFTLIDELLAFAEAGQKPRSISVVDVGSIVSRVLSERVVKIQAEDINVEVSDDLGTVTANETHVYQLFSNVIGNAIKHNTSPAPVVRVSSLGLDGDGRHRYLVSDNGPGIPPEDLENVFVPFFKGKTGETGVGLATVEKIVKIYGGEIRAYNDNGACLEFSIGDFDEKLGGVP